MSVRFEEIDQNFLEAGHLLIRKYIPDAPVNMELEEFIEYYARALWYEDREIKIHAAAIGMAFGGSKNNAQ
ncbi:hypothetical protein KDJ56_11155 [Brevibacillus composti]|uniref:Uncharacterized protein n=1 Tax=Brevibacillus composti TaxID=2796470 RepID=A0ABX7Z980_9BACL|nr:hypothetical protein [Brevibacillus composti]QUO43458.1 hypothetical protein KDJ56_11155 [Brevibacillus composti]